MIVTVEMIEVVCYRDPVGNFGDDLNDLMWKHVLPNEVYRSDRLTLIGIGSLLNAKFLAQALATKRTVVVVGSGVAYGQLTQTYENVEFLAVRGPLSAFVVGRPEAAVTDSAALLAWPKVARVLVPEAPARTDVLFMPHHHSFQFSHWDRAAKLAGVTFVDPRWPPDKILALFPRAKLVIAEAMHAAIVADTLRIPWVPVISSRRIDKFKWSDWTLSLDLPYEPVALPSSSMNDCLAQWTDNRHAGKDDAPDWRTFSSMPAAKVREYYNSRQIPGNSVRLQRSALSRMVHDIGKRTLPIFDGYATNKAAHVLATLAKRNGFLSKDEVFSAKLSKLIDAVDALRTYV